MRIRTSAVVVCLAFAPSAHAQSGERRFAERLEPFIQKTMRDGEDPGPRCRDRGGWPAGLRPRLRRHGLARSRRPVTAETLFHMASITKPFVATSLMQLAERGKADLDAPVAEYLPYFRLKDPRYRSITVRQMLTHTSGMPDVEDYLWDKPEFDDGALKRYVRSLQDKVLLWDPGTKFAYSNMAFEVLGDLVAKVSGMSFEDYVGAHILEPVGMTSSTLLVKETDPARLAAGHTQAKDGAVIPVAHYPYNRSHTPSSNLHSSATDMVRWMLVNLNRGELDGRRILKEATYDVMWKPRRRRPARTRRNQLVPGEAQGPAGRHARRPGRRIPDDGGPPARPQGRRGGPRQLGSSAALRDREEGIPGGAGRGIVRVAWRLGEPTGRNASELRAGLETTNAGAALETRRGRPRPEGKQPPCAPSGPLG